MVVNSLSFLSFFALVFVVYYLLALKDNSKNQNLWLLFASYVFYGMADYKLVYLLLSTTAVFYLLGKWLEKEMTKLNKRRASNLTTLGVCIGIGILFYFKYLNFFADSIAQLLNYIGLHVSWTTLHIILPVGVSFFTFKLISYIIEIHREHIKACDDFFEFALYIAFFPTILSGPIDRPNKFLPQLRITHIFNYDKAVDGCRQILWGLFTKMCIADNLSLVVDYAWNDYSSQSATALIIATLLYPLQMYADFDGYSNMAIGVSKVLGFDVARNFNHPFLARNPAEYWKRWHMSLTTWITDYIFMPLNISFRSLGAYGIIFAAAINMVVIGLWHGANWTYVFFGLYYGFLYIPLILNGSFAKSMKLRPNSYGLPKFSDFYKMIINFVLVAIGLIIFRAPTIFDCWQYLFTILSLQNGVHIGTLGSMIFSNIWVYVFVIIILILEWTTRDREHPLQFIDKGLFKYQCMRWGLYFLFSLLLFLFSDPGESQDFIYFQF
jgi:D-alanyl-lipoteichoic acid acyltransferase DltB (MBOAT superfamily)